MKQVIILVLCTLFVPKSVFAGVTNIRQMNQNSDGNFSVNCLNGSSETVNAQTIFNNLVCNTGNDNTSSINNTVICTGNEFMNWFYVTRVSDGKKIGDFGEKFSLKVCQQVVSASSSDVVCTGNEFMNWFYLTRISNEKKFGDRLSLETCLQLSDRKK
jgi:hypothetical protein